MINKEQLLASALRECDICIHLFGKIPDGKMEFSPSKGQRTTLELLQYLTICGVAAAEAMVNGNWDNYPEHAKRSEAMEANDFPAAMENQKTQLTTLFAGISEDDLANKTVDVPWGESFSLGQALLEMTVKFLTAYRMQLFLYAKLAGNEDIWTANLWAGVDMDKSALSAG